MTSLAPGQVDGSNAFVMIQELSQISGYSGFIVRMCDHQEDVGLQTIVRLGNGLRRGYLCDERRQEK
jgi:hypothetical protein